MDEANKNKAVVCANTAYNNRILNDLVFYHGRNNITNKC
jgi:hypothetical protein